MERLSSKDKFRVFMTEYEAGWGSKPDVSCEFSSFLAAFKFMHDTNNKLGDGKTPSFYVKADEIQWFNERRQHWDRLPSNEYHLFASKYLMERIEQGEYLGHLEYRKEKDRFRNDVTLVHMPDSYIYRMVHRSKPIGIHYKQKAYIYRSRGVSVEYYFVCPDSDTAEKRVTLADYSMAWGDGEPLHVHIPEGSPDIGKQLWTLHDEDTEAFTLLVLNAIHSREDLWNVKPSQDKTQE